jgi:hypothetical protein
VVIGKSRDEGRADRPTGREGDAMAGMRMTITTGTGAGALRAGRVAR